MHPLPETEFGGAFAGRRVLLTGHTGFKGGWLALWLARMGARVTGLALPPEPGPSLFEAAGVGAHVDSRIADIRDPAALAAALAGVDAELVVHMAAQPLVRLSYAQPVETFATNVMGTAHVLDLARRMPSLRAVVVVTSDKCYDNREWVWGYRETDPLGGADPYSASKGCTEILAHSWRRSFFADPAGPQLATVRAGNVFGGGDWAADRLVPDIMRAAAAGRAIEIRNPASVRPWQHVLEPLAGYLTLAARLLGPGAAAHAGAWNFGPDPSSTVTVEVLAQSICAAWGCGGPRIDYHAPPQPDEHAPRAPLLHEAGLLRLDSSKARAGLGWMPRLTLEQAVGLTVEWYRAHAEGAGTAAAMEAATLRQIDSYSQMMCRQPPATTAIAAQ
ncbi:CDP-glucose 4,6-dehydratase [Frigidibacter oleivorans]|uniref:CDP-glucose 4,6-dehydratase n=1 Tax=Frigidibacter oleivorans TaxID=2487129 RepID=UPI000F8D3F29|nr:CDP-glucose 4,6-dehydratase [Frigidibacter oleivorans]